MAGRTGPDAWVPKRRTTKPGGSGSPVDSMMMKAVFRIESSTHPRARSFFLVGERGRARKPQAGPVARPSFRSSVISGQPGATYQASQQARLLRNAHIRSANGVKGNNSRCIRSRMISSGESNCCCEFRHIRRMGGCVVAISAWSRSVLYIEEANPTAPGSALESG